MRVYTDAQNETVVRSVGAIVGGIEKELKQLQGVWSRRLCKDPSSFGQVEVEVHQKLQQAADQIVAGLLAEVGQQPSLEDAGKKSR